MLGDALIGTGHPLVTVAGTPVTPGRPSTESDPVPAVGPVAGRALAVQRVLDLASHGVRGTAIRLPRTVHNEGNGGFAGMLTQIARSSGFSGYPGDGAQRWPAVHALDAARLFRLALDGAPAGTAWHAVADEGDAVRDIAAVIARRLDVPSGPVPVETYGPLGPVFAIDQPSSSAHTRATLGWEPTHPGLLADLENIQPSRPLARDSGCARDWARPEARGGRGGGRTDGQSIAASAVARSATTLRWNVRWVTPLGVETTSMSKVSSSASRPSQMRTPRPSTMGTWTRCM